MSVCVRKGDDPAKREKNGTHTHTDNERDSQPK